MSDQESRIAHLLKIPIQVAVKGQMEDVQVLDLVAPTKKILRKTYTLQQYVTKAIVESQQLFKSFSQGDDDTADDGVQAESEGPTFDAKTVMVVLLASDVNIEACFKEFEKLALLGCVEVNGLKINEIQLSKIEADDMEALFCSFIANFIMSSVMGSFTGR